MFIYVSVANHQPSPELFKKHIKFLRITGFYDFSGSFSSDKYFSLVSFGRTKTTQKIIEACDSQKFYKFFLKKRSSKFNFQHTSIHFPILRFKTPIQKFLDTLLSLINLELILTYMIIGLIYYSNSLRNHLHERIKNRLNGSILNKIIQLSVVKTYLGVVN